MVTCNLEKPSVELVGEQFVIELKGQQYGCRALRANGRILYQVKFDRSFLYITKTINQHGIPFWTAIPQDVKLRHIVAEIGKQLEDTLIHILCATITASK
jgi:hypothetical protein